MGRNIIGATGKAGDRLMCHLCEERFADAGKALDDILAVHTEMRRDFPQRTQGQRVSDVANMWLHDMAFPPTTNPRTIEAMQNIALYLAAMTERVLDLKREADV